ncbi:hypothetical protein D3C87_1876260 [compost metagenome]
MFPLCTANVCPIKSGEIIERRDQVLMTDLRDELFIVSTLASRRKSIYGPFFNERAMFYLFFTTADNQFLRMLVAVTCLETLRELTISRTRLTS